MQDLLPIVCPPSAPIPISLALPLQDSGTTHTLRTPTFSAHIHHRPLNRDSEGRLAKERSGVSNSTGRATQQDTPRNGKPISKPSETSISLPLPRHTEKMSLGDNQQDLRSRTRCIDARLVFQPNLSTVRDLLSNAQSSWYHHPVPQWITHALETFAFSVYTHHSAHHQQSYVVDRLTPTTTAYSLMKPRTR